MLIERDSEIQRLQHLIKTSSMQKQIEQLLQRDVQWAARCTALEKQLEQRQQSELQRQCQQQSEIERLREQLNESNRLRQNESRVRAQMDELQGSSFELCLSFYRWRKLRCALASDQERRKKESTRNAENEDKLADASALNRLLERDLQQLRHRAQLSESQLVVAQAQVRQTQQVHAEKEQALDELRSLRHRHSQLEYDTALLQQQLDQAHRSLRLALRDTPLSHGTSTQTTESRTHQSFRAAATQTQRDQKLQSCVNSMRTACLLLSETESDLELSASELSAAMRTLQCETEPTFVKENQPQAEPEKAESIEVLLPHCAKLVQRLGEHVREQVLCLAARVRHVDFIF
ncbi:MAG: hypothetical protein MHM6MM_005527 [Cercozoa sp. M6MM]